MTTASFGRLVRFRAKNGTIYYGEVESQELITKESLAGAEVTLTVGPNTVAFIKPADTLAGPFEDIHVNSECTWMDYEAELSFIIGRDCKNATTENALDYILGYTVGNDVSSRYWQMPERSGHQHGAAKGFDKFAPIGPVIVSPRILGDPHNLGMTTKVNGVVRQQTNTDDMIFQIPSIIQHLSRGTTLRRGTVVMTGTPSGVAAFMKPQAWLNNGDVVEVEIDSIG
ncbi:hypothetical protein PENVUL_c067G09793 [Penicillium vulpinum]|uniref:Fumarylacetoacetase-like C-terminal domain-containing protein n=1 Tax=Penicillium vulpinum TaxID=29845 RepID=A0A1V6RCQ4_9EURO|nr:hypothetical protein PENVUL_c067G09793 [Penicillium vulpinum]